jgi:uncharacterized SAM-binding protein YcdF (DUF218 family)
MLRERIFLFVMGSLGSINEIESYRLLQPYTMIQSVAKFLTNPLLFIWIGLLVSLYKSGENRRRLIILHVVFYFLSIGFTGSVLSSLWEVDDKYDKDIIYDTAIILTGVIEQGDFEAVDDTDYNFRLSGTSNRLIAGIAFVKSGHAESILFGNFSTSDYDEGPVIRKFAKYQGLKEEEIRMYGNIGRTLDEANGVKIFLDARGYKNVILITSLMHMRRALGLFNRAGVFPDSYSVEKYSYKMKWKDFIPTVSGAAKVQGFFYELFGYIGYYLKGNI